MQPRRPGADAPPVLQTQPKLSKFTLRGLLTLPYRLCNPPPAVGKVRSFGLTPIFQVKLEDVLDRKHLPPLGLKDFEEWLLFVEQCPENLYFILWLREYTAKYNAWAAKVRAREEKERAKETRRARARPRTSASRKGSGGRPWRRATVTAKGRDDGRRRREMADVLEVDEENDLDADGDGNDDGDDDEFDFDRRTRGRGYRVTWTASAAYSPSLALFFTRARETFFSPASAYELVVPPDLLSPFFVGSVSVASPGPPDFSSFSPPSSSSSSSSSSPISPHPHPHPHPHHAPSLSCSNPGLGFPYPLPHPDPAVFAPLQAHIEKRLQLSLQRFVRAAYTNVGTFRATCGILAGCFALCVGCIPPLALAFASPPSPSSPSSSSSSSSPSFAGSDTDMDMMRRWKRLYALPAMWLGLTLILASLRGVCLMVYVFGDFRQLRRFELERPPPPQATTTSALGLGMGASAEKKLPNALLPPQPRPATQALPLRPPPPAAYAGSGGAHGRHSAFVLPSAMSAPAYVSHTFTTSTATATSTTSSASSSYPAPGAAAGVVPPMQVRALTAPPKISIRIPPARGHLQGHVGGRARDGPVYGHAHAQRGRGTGSHMSASASASGDTTLNSHSDAEPDAHTISISSTRKSGLGMRVPFGDAYHNENHVDDDDDDDDSDFDEEEDGGARGRGRGRGRSVRRVVLESDLDSEFDDGDEEDEEEEGEEDEEEDDNGIYISPLMPPPEEAAENDPAVFSAALALVAQAKAKAGLATAGVSGTAERGQRAEAESGEQAAERDLNLPEKEKEKEREKSANPNPNPNPNPTASFIPAFPYGVYQGTEEVDPWPAAACVAGSVGCAGPGAGAGAAGDGSLGGPAGRRPHSARRERERERAPSPVSPVADRGPCWSVKKSRPGSRSRSCSCSGSCSRPGTGTGTGRAACSRRSSRGRGGPGEKGDRRDVEKNAAAAESAECSDDDDDDDDDDEACAAAANSGLGKAEKMMAMAIPKLPMGPFDFDALPPVTRAPPQHLLHHLSHSHNQSLTHGHSHSRHTQPMPVSMQSSHRPHADGMPDLEKGTFGSLAAAAALPELEQAGSVHTPSTLAALFALLPVRFPSFLRPRRRAPSSSAHTFGDPYTSHLPPHPYGPATSQSQSHVYTYTYTCPASPASTLGPRSRSWLGGYSYSDGAASKGWRRAYAHVQRTPAFGPVTRVLSPVVSRAQWEIVVRAFFVAGLLTCVVEAALVALPARW